MIDKQLVFTDLEFDNAEEVIRFGADKLCKAGYTKETYGDSVVEREKEFPTGLPTEPFGIAIPHTNSSFVKKSGICCIKLKKPVVFHQMGNGEENIEAHFVILLAISDSSEHLELLSGLMELFTNEELLTQIEEAENEEKIAEILEKATAETGTTETAV